MNERRESLYDRSKGICPVCETEQPLNQSGRVMFHKAQNAKTEAWEPCDGILEIPSKVTHDPAQSVRRIAKITAPSLPLPRYVNHPRRRAARKAAETAVTTTRIDPKVWRKAKAAANRLGTQVVVCFRTEAT